MGKIIEMFEYRKYILLIKKSNFMLVQVRIALFYLEWKNIIVNTFYASVSVTTLKNCEFFIFYIEVYYFKF